MSTVPPNESLDTPSDVRLPWFWTLWRRNHQWRDKLNEQMARKALDIPDDEMNITTNKTGIGTAGALGIAAAAGIPGLAATGIMGYALSKKDPAPVAPGTPPPAVSPADSEYEVIFYNARGEVIDVPRFDPTKAAKPTE